MGENSKHAKLSIESADTKDGASAASGAAAAGEHDNLSTNEVRRRREAQRECGLIDMVSPGNSEST